jgi:DNA cross-link repair 1A protein
MATQVEDIKWLPNGYPVMIDGFRFADGRRCSHYILTHAHSDHTTGLRRRRFEHGRIFCTTVTAAAIEHDLALPSITLEEYLSGNPPPFDPARPVVACPLNARFPMCEGVFATFGDANHCPGAAIVVFEVPERPYRLAAAAAKGGAAGGGCLEEKSFSAVSAAAVGGGGGSGPAATPSSSTSSIVVVHTGDMRFDAGKMAAPGTPLGQLLAKGKRVHTLVLDTTYCGPRWRVPPQPHTIAALGRALRLVASGSGGGGGGGHNKHHSQQQSHRVLVAFSAYHLGKERCFFGAARALGWRVFLPPAKRRFLEVLGELSPENGYAWRLDLVAEHPWEAEIHVVGRGALNVPRQQQQAAGAGGAAAGGGDGDGNGNGNGTNGNNPRPRGGRYRSQQQQMPLAEWLQAYLDQTNAALARHQQNQHHPNANLRPFSRAAAVRASGWCFRPNGPGFSLYRPTQSTALVSVPYSEHSSFDDLVSCVGLLRPQHVIPTVGAETKQQRDALVDSLAPHGIDLRRDRSRLDAYFAEGGVAAGGVARAAALHERRLRRRERGGRNGSAAGSGEGDQEEEDEEEEEEEDLWEGERWTGAAEGGADEPGAEVDLSRVDVEGQRRALEALEREKERDRREQLRRQQLAGAAGGKGGGKRPPAAASTGAAAAAPAKRGGGGGGGIRAFFAPKKG